MIAVIVACHQFIAAARTTAEHRRTASAVQSGRLLRRLDRGTVSARDIPADKLTHVNYAFGKIDRGQQA